MQGYWFKGELEKCMTAVFLPALIWRHIISQLLYKKCIELCFTDGNIWPSKISNGSQKMLKGAKHGPQNF